jgi:hypothetical protein
MIALDHSAICILEKTEALNGQIVFLQMALAKGQSRSKCCISLGGPLHIGQATYLGSV